MGEQKVTPRLHREYFLRCCAVNIHLESVFVDEFRHFLFFNRKRLVIVNLSRFTLDNYPVYSAFKYGVSFLQNERKFRIEFLCLPSRGLDGRKDHVVQISGQFEPFKILFYDIRQSFHIFLNIYFISQKH